MSSTRDALMLVAGAAIGAFGTFVFVNATASPVERAPVATASPLGAAPPRASLEPAAEKALEAERATRQEVEARLAAVEQELSRARSAPVESGAAAAAPLSTGAPPGEKKAPLDAAQVAQKLKEIEAASEQALQAKDGKKLLALFQELAKYGKAAWPLAAKIGAKFGDMSGDGDAEELGLNGMEFFKTFAVTDFSELYTDALLHPDGYEKDFRNIALWGISMGDRKVASSVLVTALRSEKDPQALQMIAAMLAQSAPEPGTVDAIVDAIRAQKAGQTRSTLVWSLSQMKGDDATRAVASLAASETDPTTRSTLELNLKVRAAPVAGYYVAYVGPTTDGERAGFKPGDVITSFGGKATKGWQSLQAPSDTDETTLVPVEVYRDGSTLTLRVKGGKSLWELGVSGDFAKGTGH